MLRLGDTFERAAPAQSSKLGPSTSDAPAFGGTLLALLGADPAPLTSGVEARAEPEPETESEHKLDDDDAQLIAMLPGLDLLVRASDRPARDPAIASSPIAGEGRRMAQPAPLPTPPLTGTAAAAAIETVIAGVEPKSAPTPSIPVVAAAPASSPVLPAASPRTWPGVMILESAPTDDEDSRIAPRPAVATSSLERSASTRERVATAPTIAELQARRQFATQAAAASSARIAATSTQDAPAPARVRPETLPATTSTPLLSQVVTRIAEGKADALAPSHQSGKTPSIDGTPGTGGTWTSAGPAATAAAPAPDLVRAEGRASWQQALVQHVGLIVAGKTGEARLQVESGKLGPIEIHVKIDGDRVDVRFSIQHPITASLVQEALPRLEKMLELQGFSLTHSSIDQGQSRGQGERDASTTSSTTVPGAAGDDERSVNELDPLKSGRSRSANALLDDFA